MTTSEHSDRYTLEHAFNICQRNRRVCPMPNWWDALYKMLPRKAGVNGRGEPALPLILGAWNYAPPIMKILRLKEHIEWADNHGCLPKVMKLLETLREDDWLHLGE